MGSDVKGILKVYNGGMSTPEAFRVYHASVAAHIRVRVILDLVARAKGRPVWLGEVGRVACHVFDRAQLPRPWGL